MAYIGVKTTDLAAALSEEYAPEIIKGAADQSVIVPMMTRLPNLSKYRERITVLSALVTAGFVGVGGVTAGVPNAITTSGAAWENVYLTAEKIGTIVPIPKDSLDDADYDIEGELLPAIKSALALVFDQAVLHGTGKPTSYPDGLFTTATAAGNVVSLAAYADMYDAMLGEDGLFSKVEADGFSVDGIAAAMAMKSKLRGCRGSDGYPIFGATPNEKFKYQLDGEALIFAENGCVESANNALAFAGKWKDLVVAFRKDITVEVLKEATIVAGDVTINLATMDMVGLKVTMRVGWAHPNPINRAQSTKALRCNIGVLTA